MSQTYRSVSAWDWWTGEGLQNAKGQVGTLGGEENVPRPDCGIPTQLYALVKDD